MECRLSGEFQFFSLGSGTEEWVVSFASRMVAGDGGLQGFASSKACVSERSRFSGRAFFCRVYVFTAIFFHRCLPNARLLSTTACNLGLRVALVRCLRRMRVI